MKWDEVVKGINAGFDTTELQAMDTANKTGDLLKMIDAGMTAEQIRALDTDGLFSYVGATAPKTAGEEPPADTKAADPKPADAPAPDVVGEINKSIKEAFDTLTKELVKMQVAGSQQPSTEQGTDDILAQIIAPPMKERGK